MQRKQTIGSQTSWVYDGLLVGETIDKIGDANLDYIIQKSPDALGLQTLGISNFHTVENRDVRNWILKMAQF